MARWTGLSSLAALGFLLSNISSFLQLTTSRRAPDYRQRSSRMSHLELGPTAEERDP